MLDTIINAVKDGYLRTIDNIIRYPNAALWIAVCAVLAAAVWL